MNTPGGAKMVIRIGKLAIVINFDMGCGNYKEKAKFEIQRGYIGLRKGNWTLFALQWR
jgi:hypothetical protein